MNKKFNAADISKAYQDDAEESQRLVRELCADLRAIPCPASIVTKIDRLAELWGIRREN